MVVLLNSVSFKRVTVDGTHNFPNTPSANREAALSPKGIEQVEEALQQLKENDINPTIIRYAIAASSTDTANLVGSRLKVGRDRLVPEFNYLEPRAIGAWDMMELDKTTKAIWAMDNAEGGPLGQKGRPPPNQDGTPHETLAEVAIRLRQLLSVLETQYSGDTILLIGCDGTTLALLQCMIAGIPLNRVHELEYAPAEVRLDVTLDTTLAFWKQRQSNTREYQQELKEGMMELQRLRDLKDNVVSLKDRKEEQERQDVEMLYQKQQEERARLQEEKEAFRKQRAASLRSQQQEPPSPLLLGAGGVVAMGVAVVLGAASGGDGANVAADKIQERDASSTTTAATLVEDEASIATPVTPAYFDSAVDRVQKSSNPLPWNVSPEALKRVNGDRKADFQLAPVDRVVAAEQAMQDYLDQDDGGLDWLQSVSDIMMEEDDSSNDEF
jgi:broad specificity phosphatase PhoE